jgi:hypothetical protein
MMRTTMIALGFSLLAAGCVGVVESPGGGSGDDQGSGSDPGSGSNPGSGSDPTPALALSIDKPTVATELNTTNDMNVTLTGSGNFAGAITLTATAVDAVSSAPITGWTVTMDSPTVTLTENGTATVKVSVVVPSQMMSLDAKVNISATAAGVTAPPPVTSELTVTNQVTLVVTTDANGCVYPTPATLKLSVGSKLRWLNMSTSTLIIHVDGNQTGIMHEPGTTAPNTAYEQTPTAPGNGFGWYCHATGPTVNTNQLDVVQ